MKKPTLEELKVSSYLSGGNAPYVEELYDNYLENPNAVPQEWRQYFQSLGTDSARKEISHQAIRAEFAALARQPKMISGPAVAADAQQELVDNLIRAFRRFGHFSANINPLHPVLDNDPRLALSSHHLSEQDLQKTFLTRGVLPEATATLQAIYQALQDTYCGSMGIEYEHIDDDEERHWLRDQVESNWTQTAFNQEQQRHILELLTAADGLEKYLDVKYPGQKRFSIEGADALIPLLHELSRQARAQDVREFVIGMAHRGRLNVLMNVMGQSAAELFAEFDGTKDYGLTTGDVKYHRGFSSDVQTDAGAIHLSLAFNPSHLEFIDAIVMGSVRARQERNGPIKQNYAMCVQIHGDAAFSGQGVVMETLNMSQTRAYQIGGSIHIIMNNQVGFTTSNPHDSRSSHYCSDPAKMINAPVLHVNGDDPEAVVKAGRLALEYRMRFHKDVVIDLVCYRRHGHQEVDEPRATQPTMYAEIKTHLSPREIYTQQLIEQGSLDQAAADAMLQHYRDKLDQGQQVVDTLPEGLSEHYAANWTKFLNQEWRQDVDTSVSKEKLIDLAKKFTQLPEGYSLLRTVQLIIDNRKKMLNEELPIDWGFGETMAYATLLVEGHPVRLSGEDSRRGTFYHRHAAYFDQNTGDNTMPLMHLSEDQAHLQIYDSLLSEVGAMGFEYGYATADPQALVCWEAQFGDFANGAQVIVDQFMSSAWQKWNRLSGLVLLLPHGNEGMGPEHSSARLERYLQLCAQDNMQVVVPTTPAQIFHLLRRQVLRPYRKPLIVMTPKSLLRHKLAVSTLDDLAQGRFQLIIPEIDDIKPDQVKRIVLCTGKVYYELLTQRREKNIDDIAIIRIEQLYPFPYDELTALLKDYPNATEVVWCQEEPKNQGAWFVSRDRLLSCLPEGKQLNYVGRRSMAAPAAGYPALYKKRQAELVSEALTINEKE